MKFSFVISSASYETFDYCWMSVQRGMIVNFMIPISALIVATTIFGTLTLRGVAAKQREVIVESIENILEKCQHIDAVGGGVVGSGNVMPSVMEKCCDEMDKVSFQNKNKIINLIRIESHPSMDKVLKEGLLTQYSFNSFKRQIYRMINYKYTSSRR